MENLYNIQAWIIYVLFILVIILVMWVVPSIQLTSEIDKYAYIAFMLNLKLKSSVEYWEDKLIKDGYSVDYISENAIKYRDEYLESYKLSLEDVNMTFRQYLKYLKLINKPE